MKKILLATVAVALLAPAAAKAEVNLDLGGYFKGYAGYADQDTNNLRTFDVKRKSQVFFTGETTLDNGLSVGYKGDLFQENSSTTASVERSYLYFSGNWGRVNLGRETGAAYLLQVAAPSADSNIDGQDTDISFFNASGNVDEDYQQSGSQSGSSNAVKFADKITYMTPKFNGFQAGVSYSAAVDQKDTASALNGMEPDNDPNDLENLMEVAARYDGEFNGVGIAVGAGYTKAGEEAETVSSDDYSEWNTGIKLSYDAFGIGAAYNEDNGQVKNNGDTKNWTVGADYTWGAYVFGASYFNSTNDVSATTEDELDRYAVGASYTFGPGMKFNGSVAAYDLDRVGTANDNEATVVAIGTDIQF